MTAVDPRPLTLPAFAVAGLRDYLARAAALLDEARAAVGSDRFDALMRERAEVHTEMAGYLASALDVAQPDGSR